MLYSQPNKVVVAAFLAFISTTSVCGSGEVEKDLHRPPCRSARCRKIQAFIKTHYCGTSPFGNGPDNGCDTSRSDVGREANVATAYRCKRDDASGKAQCRQRGAPPSDIREALIREMRRAGLPAEADKHVFFTVLEAQTSAVSLAAGNYSRVSGTDLTLCQVILVIRQNETPRVIKKVRFQKTDADVPRVTTWSLVDIADVEGIYEPEFVLEADAYENHWFEVISLEGGTAKRIFSGLGYYL